MHPNPSFRGTGEDRALADAAERGFGVLTLRGSTTPLKLVGISGALASLAYLFSVAMTRDASPWG